MYDINKADFILDAPWRVPFEHRISKLIRMKTLGQRMVCYIYELADTSTFRYRVYNMCQALDLSNDWKGVYFFKNELRRIEKYIEFFDCVIIARFCWTLELEEFINHLKERDIPVGFDTDDMVYSNEYIKIIMNSLSVEHSEDRYDYWYAYTSRLGSTLKLCDFAITTNQFLASKIGEDTGKKTYIVTNFYNRIQSKVSEEYFNEKLKIGSKKPFQIGYFSGTPSHINDFLSIAPEIIRLIDKEEIVLVIVGFMELPSHYSPYLNNGKIIRIPLQNFIDLQYEMAKVDVSIVPLLNNQFTNCKSELKFFEGGIVGTITCATPIYTYSKIIRDKENGFFCEEGEWYHVLREIYEMDEKDRIDMVMKARQDAEKKYSYYNITDIISTVLSDIIKQV